MSEHPIAKEAYEQLAEAYSARAKTKAHNADYERPATLSLLPPMRGKRVLDAGCGPGIYAEKLIEMGAEVVSFDVAENMVRIARERVGNRATVHCADLARPLTFAESASFDVVLSPLALDYVRDWSAVFKEFHRVLRSSGLFIFSMEHPGSRWRMDQSDCYFQVEQTECMWHGFGKRVMMPSFRRPWQEVLNPLVESGFHFDRVLEPVPRPAFREKEPKSYEELMRGPGFLSIRARKP